MKERTSKQYLRRSKFWRGLGTTVIGLTTVGAFFVYQAVIDFENLKQELDTIAVVVNEDTVKLNMWYALVTMIGLVLFLFISWRRNRELIKQARPSMILAFVVIFLYLLYSIIEISLFSLVGALAGTVLDDLIFGPLARKNKRLAGDEKEYEVEYKKELRRQKAKRDAQMEIDGSV